MTYVDNVCMSEYGFIVCVVWLFLDVSVSWIFFNDLRCDVLTFRAIESKTVSE